MNVDKIKAVIGVYRLLTNSSKDNSDISGELHLDTDAIEKLETLSTYPDIYLGKYIYDKKEYSEFSDHLGCNVSIEFTVSASYFYDDFNHFLNNNSNIRNIPDAYYLSNINYFYPEDPTNEQVEYYEKYVKFIKFLENLSDYCSNLNLIFISREKLNVTIKYSESDLYRLESLDTLICDFSQEEKDLDQKRILLKRVIVSMLKNIDEQSRFIELCQKFEIMVTRYRDNYYLFLEDIDIDTILNDVRKKKVEYLASIAKVYSDMQGKLLTIPITLIPLTQTKNDCLSNAIILVGIIIYVILMLSYVLSQWLIIVEVHKDKEQYYSQLESKYNKAFCENFKNILDSINKRYYSIRSVVWIILSTLLLIVFVNFYVLVYVPHFL